MSLAHSPLHLRFGSPFDLFAESVDQGSFEADRTGAASGRPQIALCIRSSYNLNHLTGFATLSYTLMSTGFGSIAFTGHSFSFHSAVLCAEDDTA